MHRVVLLRICLCRRTFAFGTQAKAIREAEHREDRLVWPRGKSFFEMKEKPIYADRKLS
jgi:hypothetical protein